MRQLALAVECLAFFLQLALLHGTEYGPEVTDSTALMQRRVDISNLSWNDVEPAQDPNSTASSADSHPHKVIKCEDIFVEAECADSFNVHGVYCLGWGGEHCIPRSGAKCSDIAREDTCHDNPWGMVCVWSHKG
eukprot:CAMPEP_0171064976 /NCGR_PEP_ID=MMETSP0766_2-20121228/6590_1 /TAXON_ID=439317 /ORGANISM="Gambierdiscus australes, Strain CAWD 149" /LENGTH=133 /DNA_ID=CAMNT_0011521045 /DNA_START=59 /DNA_END=457 /DNA_ORIENTATION=+